MMVESQEYLFGWLAYFGAVACLLVVFWFMTKPLPWVYLRQSLRLIAATLFLVPVEVEGAVGYWSPAWIKGLLHLVFSEIEAFLPVGKSILIAILAVLMFYFIVHILLHFFRAKGAKSA